jgi:hypothetical protein
VKHSYRLDYTSLAEILGQRGLVEPQRLKLALQSSLSGPIPFPELLVGEGLIGDWELSRVVCDLFGLPFLPVDLYQPAKDSLDGLDQEFLRTHRLVPLSRHKRLLTVCMPALVPADVLAQLALSTDLQVMPVVGSVETNNRWLTEHLAAPTATEAVGDWNKIFDAGDAAVLFNLDPDAPEQASDGSPYLPPDSFLQNPDLDDPDQQGSNQSAA